MRPVAFDEALSAGTRLTLFSDDKPDRFFAVIKSGWMQPQALHLSSRLVCPPRSKTACRAEGPPPQGLRRDKLCRRREEGRTHLLIHLPIEEQNEHRWCLWRPDHAGFDSRSIFEGCTGREKDQHWFRDLTVGTALPRGSSWPTFVSKCHKRNAII